MFANDFCGPRLRPPTTLPIRDRALHSKVWPKPPERAEMYTHPQRRASELTQKLRKQAGVWLRELREKRGLSQRELAARVGGEYYTFISQLESGRGRIPPDRYLSWAHAFEIDKREFARTLMSFYDPVTHGILFDQTGESRSVRARPALGGARSGER